MTNFKFLSVLCVAGEMDHSCYDCFVLVVMTYGDDGGVFFDANDKVFTLTELMAPIKRCRTLAGKPKICITQVSSLI